MQRHNKRDLESLSLFTHICGLVSVFLGLVVVFCHVLETDTRGVLSGLYIFFSGYTFFKISERLSRILLTER